MTAPSEASLGKVRDDAAPRRILVTGATGKTGRRLVSLLKAAGVDHLAASRSPGGDPAARVFDWLAPATHDAILEAATALYVVFPVVDQDPAGQVIEFCGKALSRGVRRIVLLSGSLAPEGGPRMGQLHAWLRANAPEWAVLQPSWFMQNFIEPFSTPSIRDEGVIYSAAGSGRLGFVDVQDIARSAFGALTTEAAPNRAFVLTGPEALSYDDVAAKISRAAGHAVRHVSLSPEAYTQHLIANGFGKGTARTLAWMDGLIADGAEDRVTDGVLSASGAPPSAFDAFASANAQAWARSSGEPSNPKEPIP